MEIKDLVLSLLESQKVKSVADSMSPGQADNVLDYLYGAVFARMYLEEQSKKTDTFVVTGDTKISMQDFANTAIDPSGETLIDLLTLEEE